MSAWLAARTAVGYLVCGLAIAHAERRPVAVIDLSDSPSGEQLAKDLGNVLNNHAELKPIDDPTMWGELIGPIADEDLQRLDDVRARRQAADEAIQNRGDFVTAAATAETAQSLLLFATPTPQVLALYAELAFLAGNARLGQRRAADAALAFRLAHQLDPKFAPVAARTFPEVLQAFDAALRAPAATGAIAVSGTGRVVLDGAEVGTSPGSFEVPAGSHVVWLVGPERDPRGKQVVVGARQAVEAPIDDAPTSKTTKVRRSRLALKLAPDPTARAAVIAQLATVLETHDAVVLTSADGKTVVQTWRDRAHSARELLGFSALKEWTSQKPLDLLRPLAPPPIKPPPPPTPPLPPKRVERSWLARNKYWVGGGTVAALVIGVVLYGLNSWDRTLQSDPDPTFRGSR